MKDPVDLIIAENLKKLRLHHKYTQIEIAQKIQPKISNQQYRKYETAENKISASMLVKFCLIYNCSPYLILGKNFREDKRTPTTSELMRTLDDTKLLSNYHSIKHDNLKKIIKDLIQLAKGY